MALHFQPIISGSSGNCLLLWTEESTLLIDAGFRSQRGFVELLGHVLPEVDGVVVSHLHGDHINYPSLRVLEDRGVPVYVYEGDAASLGERHFRGREFGGLDLRPFSSERFGVGEFSVEPFELPHEPGCTTFGFEVSCTQKRGVSRVVLATDFREWRDSRGRFERADLLYVEANHDLDLLRRYPNYASRYHLSNPKCGQLLRHALDGGGQCPSAVVLGHLSAERNEPNLALDTVGQILDEAGHRGVELRVARRFEPSEAIRVSE